MFEWNISMRWNTTVHTLSLAMSQQIIVHKRVSPLLVVLICIRILANLLCSWCLQNIIESFLLLVKITDTIDLLVVPDKCRILIGHEHLLSHSLKYHRNWKTPVNRYATSSMHANDNVLVTMLMKYTNVCTCQMYLFNVQWLVSLSSNQKKNCWE